MNKNRDVAFEITPNSGQSYKELARRLHNLEIDDFTIIANWLMSLFDENGLLIKDKVRWINVNNLLEDQVRDEKVDTAYAKSLNFTLEALKDDQGNEIPDQNIVALNTPGVCYKLSGNLKLPIGLHRFWKAKEIGAFRFPVIQIPDDILSSVSMKSIHAMCRMDNSVIHQAKSSTLAQDAATVLEIFAQYYQDRQLQGVDLPLFDDIVKDKAICREQYPEYWELLRVIASQVSVAHGAVQIRNHLFKEIVKSGFKSFLNGKIDQVRSSLKKTHAPHIEDGREVGNKFISNNDKSVFEITLCEGGQQQEQNSLARLSRKRVTEGGVIIGIICGVGASTSALITSRISSLELFLPLAANNGFDVVEKILTANYKDGFLKYPQFIQGLEKQSFKIGNKEYEISCPAEDDSGEWKKISVQQVISFLRRFHLKNPNAVAFEEYEEEIGKLVLPENCVVKEVVSNKKSSKKAA